LLSIRDEIRNIEEAKSDKKDNALKNAPHTQALSVPMNGIMPIQERSAFPVILCYAE